MLYSQEVGKRLENSRCTALLLTNEDDGCRLITCSSVSKKGRRLIVTTVFGQKDKPGQATLGWERFAASRTPSGFSAFPRACFFSQKNSIFLQHDHKPCRVTYLGAWHDLRFCSCPIRSFMNSSSLLTARCSNRATIGPLSHLTEKWTISAKGYLTPSMPR